MVEDGGSPFDCVDLCHECTVDETCCVEELVGCPFGVLRMELVADGVVFKGKERMHQFKTYPPVVVEASIGDAVRITRKKSFGFG